MTTINGHQVWRDDASDELTEAWQIERDALALLAADWATIPDREHGARSPERSYHAGVKSDQTATGGTSPAPDPFVGTRHESKPRRSSKGRSTFEVKRRGTVHLVAPDPLRDDGADVADDGRVLLHTFDAVTLAAMADAWCRARGVDLEPIVGTVQGVSWEAITEAPGSREALTLAQHRTDLFGGFLRDARRAVIGSAARSDHKYRPTHSLALGWTLGDMIGGERPGAPARDVKRFPISRMRLPLPRARKGDPDAVPSVSKSGRPTIVHCGTDDRGNLVTYGDPEVRRIIIDDASRPGRTYRDGSPLPTRTRTVLRRVPTERVAIGHRWQDRPGGKRQVESVKRERAANAVRVATASETGAAIVAAWNAATIGESVALTTPTGTRLTFTRRDGAVVTYRWTRGTDGGRFPARTPAAAAMRAVTLGI